jgi:hypothetical protein
MNLSHKGHVSWFLKRDKEKVPFLKKIGTPTIFQGV